METYKFWFTVDIPEERCDADSLQKLFQSVADKIQEVCPFDDDTWDFSCSSS